MSKVKLSQYQKAMSDLSIINSVIDIMWPKVIDLPYALFPFNLIKLSIITLHMRFQRIHKSNNYEPNPIFLLFLLLSIQLYILEMKSISFISVTKSYTLLAQESSNVFETEFEGFSIQPHILSRFVLSGVFKNSIECSLSKLNKIRYHNISFFT